MAYRWSKEAEAAYDHVRLLGSGAFSSIWIGKSKNGDESEEVAIKTTVIRTRDNPDHAFTYAQREVAILQQLDHPHVMKIAKTFAADVDANGGPLIFSVALTLALGPTLQQLVEHGGALGLPMAHLVAQQLISAVAYVHSNAVIHRDIKPDNVIVTHASLQDDDNWSNDAKVGSKTWHVVLVDFGFSRALTPNDVSDDIGLYKAVHRDTPGQAPDVPNIEVSLDEALARGKGAEWDKSKSGGKTIVLDESISDVRLLDMSAVGNKDYAAPEILRTIRKYEEKESNGSELNESRGTSQHSVGTSGSAGRKEKRTKRQRSSILQRRRRRKRNKPLGRNVADYGMVADAYSLGAVLRYILTGVPPSHNIDEYIGLYNSPMAQFMEMIGFLFMNCRKDPTKEGKRKLQFRRNSDIPKEAANLVRSLTNWNEHDRCTVRAAVHHPWIAGGAALTAHQQYVHEPIEFLDLEELEKLQVKTQPPPPLKEDYEDREPLPEQEQAIASK